MQKKLIIFDLDNTLFQSKESYKYILAEVLLEKWGINENFSVKSFENTEKEMSVTKEYSTIKEFYKEFNNKFLCKIIDSVDHEKIKEFSDILIQMKELVPMKLKTYPAVKETLKQLKTRGYKLAILTGTWEKKIESFKDLEYAKKKREILERLLENSGLNKIVDKLFITYEHSTVKPDPKAFDLVLKDFGVSAQDTIMIGDKEADLLASKIGISPILFDPKLKYAGETKPDYKFTNFSELISIIESYN